MTKLLTGAASVDAESTLPPALELPLSGAVFVTDARRRVVYANRSASELAWRSGGPMLGRDCRDVFRCIACPPQCPLIQGGKALGGREVVLRRRDGRPVPLLKKAEALLDDAGHLVGGFEVMHDLSAVRRSTPGDVLTSEGVASGASAAPELVGSSPAMKALRSLVDRLARVDAPVLVSGESGVGKELVSRAIHDRGPRAGRPFQAVNCAALPHELLESELFGHERGAFTGAVRDKPGRFEVCEDGTLLLDEVGCLPLALQAKLLRVLDDGGFERVGCTRRRQLRARVIAATNADLETLVRRGAFRADLMYRLDVCSVRVPPLRERIEDVPALAEFLARALAPSCGVRSPRFTAAAMEALQRYDWPGNVRELRNAVHAALVISSDEPIGCEHLRPSIAARAAGRIVCRDRIEDALSRARYDRAAAASLLGVSRTTLWRHMRRAGLL